MSHLHRMLTYLLCFCVSSHLEGFWLFGDSVGYYRQDIYVKSPTSIIIANNATLTSLIYCYISRYQLTNHKAKDIALHCLHHISRPQKSTQLNQKQWRD